MKKVAGFFLFWLFAGVCHGQTILAILNGASYSTSIAPGTWVAIFGTQLAPGALAAAAVPFPARLNNVSVTFAGIAAPLSYVSPGQVNALVPFEAASLTSAQKATVACVVTTPAGASPAFLVTLMREAPAIFTKNAQGTGEALVFDPYFRPVTAVGTSAIVLYATGLGPTNPAASTGALGAGAEPLNRIVDTLSVSVGQNPANVLFAGLAPGMQGIYQINLLPNPSLGNGVSVAEGNSASSPVTVPVTAGTNVANATGTIDGLYPASGAMAAQHGGNATSGAVGFSAMPLAGTFTTGFDILPGAKPFKVVATATAQNTTGSANATISIDPGNNTWQATYTVPTQAARNWDLSGAGFMVADFLSGLPFPGNVIPLSRVDPIAVAALNILPPVSAMATAGANATNSTSGTLPAGGHIAIGAGVLPQLANFGGFVNLQNVAGGNTATFQLYVDNMLVVSKAVPFTVY